MFPGDGLRLTRLVLQVTRAPATAPSRLTCRNEDALEQAVRPRPDTNRIVRDKCLSTKSDRRGNDDAIDVIIGAKGSYASGLHAEREYMEAPIQQETRSVQEHARPSRGR